MMQNLGLLNVLTTPILMSSVFVFGSTCGLASTWITLDFPGASETYPRAINNGRIVGQYYDSNAEEHMFLYDNSTWTTLVIPNAESAAVTGIDGDNIVGKYTDAFGHHGFLYDGSRWTTLDMPDAEATSAAGIDGDNIVGGYTDAFGRHGFLYDGENWSNTFIQHPIKDIDGNNMISSDGATSSFYDGSEWSPLVLTGASSVVALGIEGNNIVGTCYFDSNYHGFLYDGINWTVLDVPGASTTIIHGIDGNQIVGEYYDNSGHHGFLYTIPEPAMVLLLGFGGVILRAIRKSQ